MEVVLNAMDSYESTAVKACGVLGMKAHDRTRPTKFTLLRLSGAVIPNSKINGETWTLGRYVELVFSTCSRPNIGVHIENVSYGSGM